MIKSQVNGIFQTPIYRTTLTQDFSEKQLSFIDKNKTHDCQSPPGGNLITSDKSMLEKDIFKNIKQELDLIIQDYFEKIISPSNNITPYITQSWLNYMGPNQQCHTHTHSNSYVSGILYVKCHETLDKITFYNEDYHAIELCIKNQNLFNSDSWVFPVKTKDVVMFPSSLTHGVDTTEGDDTRISLVFNVFIKGTLGAYPSATELILK